MAKELLEVMKTRIGLEELPDYTPPFTKWLRPVILDVKEDSLTFKVVVREEMTNGLGILHGGIQAAILDEVMGMTVMCLDKPDQSVSINLTVDYLGKAVVGQTLICRSQLVRQGKTVVNMIGEINDEAGKPIARSTSNLLNLSMKK